jgi:hypothetical protein
MNTTSITRAAGRTGDYFLDRRVNATSRFTFVMLVIFTVILYIAIVRAWTEQRGHSARGARFVGARLAQFTLFVDDQ